MLALIFHNTYDGYGATIRPELARALYPHGLIIGYWDCCAPQSHTSVLVDYQHQPGDDELTMMDIELKLYRIFNHRVSVRVVKLALLPYKEG